VRTTLGSLHSGITPPVTNACRAKTWQEDLNATHRTARARVEDTLARMKSSSILRVYRRAAGTPGDTASGIADLHNTILTG
jgi:hypothetical protein